ELDERLDRAIGLICSSLVPGEASARVMKAAAAWDDVRPATESTMRRAGRWVGAALAAAACIALMGYIAFLTTEPPAIQGPAVADAATPSNGGDGEPRAADALRSKVAPLGEDLYSSRLIREDKERSNEVWREGTWGKLHSTFGASALGDKPGEGLDPSGEPV